MRRRTYLAKFFNRNNELIHWQLYLNSYYAEAYDDAAHSGYFFKIESEILSARKSRLNRMSFTV